MSTPKSVLPDDHPVSTWDELVLFLGGSADSFTGLLLILIAKADPGNLARLRAGFPKHVAAWEIWRVRSDTLTSGELQSELAAQPVSDPAPDAAFIHGVLDANPLFRRSVTDFMMCLDAKRVLERTKPPMYETAAAYLEEVGLTLIRETGLPEEFIQACIAAQPPED